jgi:hypothetical protein
MKIVLIDKVTGRYYHGPGQWVRRSDNARIFDDLTAARQFSRVNDLPNAHPVERLAPHVMELLQRSTLNCWSIWSRGPHIDQWFEQSRHRFFRN